MSQKCGENMCGEVANLHGVVAKLRGVVAKFRKKNQTKYSISHLRLVGMEGGINPDAILDYVEFHIYSSQNRYEASVRSNNIEENVVSGPLDRILLHSPEIKNLSSKPSSTKFKILPPESVNDVSWFTKTTLARFLHIIGLPDILTIGNEISQLEETRNFQLSLSNKAEVDITTSVESKNELLQAVDLRLTTLKEELADVINQGIGSKSSPKDISDLANFAFHFGAKEFRDALQKVAEIERHRSTEDEDSRFSSEEDQPSVERSRGLTRSAMPRRSASPMRRIQIGRSGSRRAAALSIKNLNVFPKSASQRDAAGSSSEDEDSQRPTKSNALKMSVQDKISLFESKQKDQGVDIQKTKPTVGANKAILKRWITGSGTSTGNSSPSSSKNVASDDKRESDSTINKTESCAEKGTSHQLGVEAEAVEPERDWSEQKEAELDEPTKLMDSNPVRPQNANIADNESMNPKEQRGGLYELYKNPREDSEATGKRVEIDSQFKEMQKPVDEKKVKMASNKVSGVNRRQNEPQKSQKNSTQLLNSRTTKPSAVKKSTLKSSPLPATRKSWPSTPSPQASEASPARTPSRPTSTSSTPTNRKPHTAGKIEKLQPQLRTPKATPPDANKRINTRNEKKQPIGAENKKITKTNVLIPKEDAATTATAKPSFYNKVTRKNSVVPLETKPFLRKGSGVGRGAGPVVNKAKVVGQKTEENKEVTRIGITNQNEETEFKLPENSANLDLEPQVVRLSPTKCEESERNCSSAGGPRETELVVSDINTTTEEAEISPTAWVVSEENDQDEIIPCKESPVKLSSPANVTPPAGYTDPRVRHSLFQMFSEDSNKADIGEWGNAEHPSTLVFQKDAPRGLKRLLKFSRKAKADSHQTGWSNSPSPFSEGEDDADESKGQSNFGIFDEQNHVSASMNTTKATRSFFSLSAFRANKSKETKFLHH